MNETESNVYDLIYPSPITLKEISSIVVAVDLWRKEICSHIASESLSRLNLDFKEGGVRLKNVIPNLPSALYDLLEDYVTIFGNSIWTWLNYHWRVVFARCDQGYKMILSRFHDFSWDWAGTVHYGRTAKRTMLSDQLTDDEKFKIACLYCFEDDIKRIWPSVSAKFDSHPVNFNRYPELFYWICFLRNELDKVPNPRNVSMDEAMLYKCTSKSINLPFVKYFWDRIPSDKRLQIVIEMFREWNLLFCRFILQKLNKHQLEMFMTAKGDVLVGLVLEAGSVSHLDIAFRTWMYFYVRNQISSSLFVTFVERSFQFEADVGIEFYAVGVGNLFCKIWESAPQHWKRLAVEHVVSNNPSYNNSWVCSRGRKPMKVLITLLQDANVEERNVLWRENWRNWVSMCGADNSDLLVVMKLCLQTDTEDEIALFNRNTIARYENIAEYCAPLLAQASFKELNDFLSVCCPDLEKRSEFKQRLLRSNYVGENSILTSNVIGKNKLLNEFINDAFQDAADLGVEFRNQFASSPVTQNCLFKRIPLALEDLDPLMEFVDSFFSDEQIVVPLKKRLFFERFKEHRLINGDFFHTDSDDVIRRFVIWLLGSEDEVVKFKQSISVEDIFRKMVPLPTPLRILQSGEVDNSKREFPEKVDNFLMWYFNKDEEEIDKFIKLFSDEMASFSPRKSSKMGHAWSNNSSNQNSCFFSSFNN